MNTKIKYVGTVVVALAIYLYTSSFFAERIGWLQGLFFAIPAPLIGIMAGLGFSFLSGNARRRLAYPVLGLLLVTMVGIARSLMTAPFQELHFLGWMIVFASLLQTVFVSEWLTVMRPPPSGKAIPPVSRDSLSLN